MNSTPATDAPPADNQPARKSPVTVRTLFLLGLLALAAYLFINKGSFTGKPSAGMARDILRQRIEEQGKGNVRLVSFEKVNAVEGVVLGQTLYELQYEAEIEFLETGSWLQGAMGTKRFEFSKERYGGSFSSQVAASLDGAVAVKQGQHEKLRGTLQFKKTERGWQGEDGRLY